MDDHLGYENHNVLIAVIIAMVISEEGIVVMVLEIEVPQDRKSTFEPSKENVRKTFQISIRRLFLCMQKGMTTRQISETIEDIYGFETSEGFISDVKRQRFWKTGTGH